MWDKTFLGRSAVLIIVLWVFGSVFVDQGTLAACSPSPAGVTRFAVIGDFGLASQAESDVANLVKGWCVDFIITVGDNNYEYGGADTIDVNIGQYYHDYIYPYPGTFGSGEPNNISRFFPAMGNHDWYSPSAAPYLSYFSLPGNERYYTFTQGPMQFFAIDSDPNEPDGIVSNSIQANWLQTQLASSTAQWKLVYMHHPPYSSGFHGSTVALQWPYQAWGASAVLAGHDHHYERLGVGGLPYFVNGLGGKAIYSVAAPIAGSQVQYNADFGAMLVEATQSQMTFKFITRAGTVIDTYILPESAPTSTPTLTPTLANSTTIAFQDGVSPSNNYFGTIDTQILQSAPSTNYGAVASLNTDGDEPPGSGQDAKILLRWDVSAIPTGSTVTSASLTFNITNGTTNTYTIYEMQRAWSEAQATWNIFTTGNNWELAGATGANDAGTTGLGAVGANTLGSYTVNLNTSGIAVVQNWVNDPFSNHGLIIADSNSADGVDIDSRESSMVSSHPRLAINYLAAVAPPTATLTSGVASTSTATPTTTPTRTPTKTLTGTLASTSTATPTQTLTITNIAPNATVSVSSQHNANYAGGKAIDGVIGQNDLGEWASLGEKNPWIQLIWVTPRQVTSINLYDRINLTDAANSGMLTFSDGSSLTVSGIPNNGTVKTIAFAAKTITWVRFQISGGTGLNVGLSEIQVLGLGVTTPTSTRTYTATATRTPTVTATKTISASPTLTSTPTVTSTRTATRTVTGTAIVAPTNTATPVLSTINIALNATVSVSTHYNANYVGTKAVDGVVGKNDIGEWASLGEKNPWIKLTWAASRQVVSIKLYDRVNTIDAVNGGVLTFSDGSSLSVAGIPNDGAVKTVTFPVKTITWVKFQVSGGVGLNVGLSEMQVMAYP